MINDKFTKWILSIILLYFLVFSSLFLDSPGLNIDEGLHGTIALNFISGRNPFSNLDHIYEIYYWAPIMGYLSIPFLLIFGPSVFVLRFVCVLFSLGSLICIYYVCSRWFNKKVGLIATFLVAINTSFIRATRVGLVREEIFQIFLFWLGLALIQSYLDKGKRKYLYFAAFSFGLALSAKIMFLGYFFGVVFAAIAMLKDSKDFVKTKLIKNRRVLAKFIFSFVLGASHLIGYNILNRANTVTSLWNNFFNTTVGRWNNLSFLQNLNTRLVDLISLISNNLKIDHVELSSQNVHMFFFFVSLMGLLMFLFFSKKEVFSKRKIAFLLILYVMLFFLTCFVPDTYWPGHILIIMPIIQIIEAIFLVWFLTFLVKYKNIAFSLLAIFLGLNLYLYSHQNDYYIKSIKNEKATKEFSYVFNDLAKYLEHNNITEVVCLTNYIGPNLDFITFLKVSSGKAIALPLSYQGLTVKSLYEQRVKNFHHKYFVVEYMDRGYRDVYTELKEFALADGMRSKLVNEFIDDKGFYLVLYYIGK